MLDSINHSFRIMTLSHVHLLSRLCKIAFWVSYASFRYWSYFAWAIGNGEGAAWINPAAVERTKSTVPVMRAMCIVKEGLSMCACLSVVSWLWYILKALGEYLALLGHSERRLMTLIFFNDCTIEYWRKTIERCLRKIHLESVARHLRQVRTGTGILYLSRYPDGVPHAWGGGKSMRIQIVCISTTSSLPYWT